MEQQINEFTNVVKFTGGGLLYSMLRQDSQMISNETLTIIVQICVVLSILTMSNLTINDKLLAILILVGLNIACLLYCKATEPPSQCV